MKNLGIFFGITLWIGVEAFAITPFEKSLQSQDVLRNLFRASSETVTGADGIQLIGKSDDGTPCSLSVSGLKLPEDSNNNVVLLDLISGSTRLGFNLDSHSDPKLKQNEDEVIIKQTDLHSRMNSIGEYVYLETYGISQQIRFNLNSGRIREVQLKNDSKTLICTF